MPAYIGKFLRKQSKIPNLEARVLVHEDTEESIQGGIAGEHYHLSAAELAQALTPAINDIYEPIMIGGALVTTVAGDLLMADGGHDAA